MSHHTSTAIAGASLGAIRNAQCAHIDCRLPRIVAADGTVWHHKSQTVPVPTVGQRNLSYGAVDASGRHLPTHAPTIDHAELSDAATRLAALVKRRRAVRAGRYADANAAMAPARLPGVAVASTGDQVLTDDAIAHNWQGTGDILRRGRCHGPVVTIDPDTGAADYLARAAMNLGTAIRARRVTAATAVKRVVGAIDNVAAGKRPEGWARDRIHQYAHLVDVDVYDTWCDALDDALVARETARETARDEVECAGASMQASGMAAASW